MPFIRLLAFAFAFILLGLGTGRVSQAAVIAVDLGIGAPPSSLGGFGLTSVVDDRPQYSSVNSVTSPFGGEIGFSETTSKREIGSGWLTWSHGFDGSVYFARGATSLTLTLPEETTAFAFYLEPNLFETFSFDVTEAGGTGLTVESNGHAGAVGVGFYTDDGSALGPITISGLTDFAVGEFLLATAPPSASPQQNDVPVPAQNDVPQNDVLASVPISPTLPLLIAGMIGIGFLSRQRR